MRKSKKQLPPSWENTVVGQLFIAGLIFLLTVSSVYYYYHYYFAYWIWGGNLCGVYI